MQQVNGLYDSYHLMIQKWSVIKMHVFKYVYKVYENDFKSYTMNYNISLVSYDCIYSIFNQALIV